MLEVKGLQAGYGKKQVLFGVSLKVAAGEIVALIGPNGAGKSTMLKAICGLVPIWHGKLVFDGTVTNGSKAVENIARGMIFAPQGKRVFDELTVMENLEIGGFRLRRSELNERIEDVLAVFPALKERTKVDAGRLSGGEQQMLALARALIPKPKLLMLDEPSLGLSPILVKSVFEKIREINRETGAAMLIVEQKVRKVLGICHRAYSLKLGRLAFSGSAGKLQRDPEKLRDLFL